MKARYALAFPLLAALSGGATAQKPAPAVEAAAPCEVHPTVHMVRLSGAYADLAEASGDLTTILLGGGAGKVKPFYELIDQLDALAKDDAVARVLFDLSEPVQLNLAQTAEMERCLARLRAAGKHTFAYLQGATLVDLQLAAGCEHVLMADMGGADLRSLALSTTFMRDALEFLGIQMDVLRCGDFKGAAEPYMLSQMSPHLRRHYADMLTYMNDDVVRRIAAGRGLPAGKVRDMQRQRVFSAKEALVAGLVDRLVPWQGATTAMSTLLGDKCTQFVDVLGGKKKRKSFNLMAVLQDLFKPADEEEVEEEQTIAVYHLSGPISDGEQPVPGSIVSGPAVRAIRELAGNDRVKGVVVRINSPGGSATASEAVVLALAELAEKKPVVCSMGYVAGSGGYYVTCFGRPILAEAGTITGSIGVLGMKPNVGPLMRRIGLHQETVALDDSATLDSIDRGWTDQEKAMIQTRIDDVYDRFLDHVAKSRHMPREAVERIAGGRVWSGEQAVANKLIDGIGGLEDAIAMVARDAGLEKWETVHMPRPRSFMDVFAESLLDVRMALPTGIPSALLERLDLQTPLAVLVDALTSRQPTRVWAMMPSLIRVE